MERVPEPVAVMDEAEQALAYARADFADVNRRFIDRFIELFGDFESGRVLDLGCGPADIPIRLCRELPGVAIVAADASRAMIEIARADIAAAGLASRIALRLGMVDGSPIDGAAFDAVVSNSLLHHVDKPLEFWSTVANNAKPDAPILVVDLFRPPSREDAMRIVDAASPNEPEILRRDFFNSLLAAYSRDEIRDQLRAANLAHLSCEIVSDRHVAVWGRAL
ncbi:MAG: methyltransferase domain-containing protein [Deltaproteobacteria bacterium]|nr:methyltransferase domain-containing protein [Deltaproteobacteria bacterium]